MYKSVKHLCGLFIAGDVDRAIEKYNLEGLYYRDGDYLDIRCTLYKFEREFAGDPRRQFIWNLFDKIMDVCSDGVQDSENREKLIAVLEYFLMSVKNRCYHKGCRSRDVVKNRDTALGLLLNIICAFSDNEYKIQYLAMIYDMMQKWNDTDNSFLDFYGESAIECIKTNTLRILNQAKIKEKYIKNTLKEEDRIYIRNFCEIILDLWNPDKRGYVNNSNVQKAKSKMIWVKTVLSIFLVLFIAYMFFYEPYAKLNGNKKDSEKVIEEMKNDISKLTNRIENMDNELKEQVEQFNTEKAKADEELQKIEQELENLKQKQQTADNGNLNGEASGEQEKQNYVMPITSKIRQEKNEESVALGMVEEGKEVSILEEQDDQGWLRISYQGIQGYVKIEDNGTDN